MFLESGAGGVAISGGEPPAALGAHGGGDGRPGAFDTGRFGMFAFMGTVSMLFIGFTSALMLRRTSADWQPLVAPGALWASTVALAASSAVLEAARRRADARRLLLALSALLGLAFVASQFAAWRSLAAQGVYLATNPASSFFYMLTGIHLVHLFGGLAWLLGVAVAHGVRSGVPAPRLDLLGLYWHFLGALWLYLVVVLFVI